MKKKSLIVIIIFIIINIFSTLVYANNESTSNKTKNVQSNNISKENTAINNSLVKNNTNTNNSIANTTNNTTNTMTNNVIKKDNTIKNSTTNSINNTTSEKNTTTNKNNTTNKAATEQIQVESDNSKARAVVSNGIQYRTHVQNIGWQNYTENSKTAGTEGKSLRLEAINIKLETSDDYSVMYRVHVQNIGWQEWKTDGEVAGTEGRSLRLEAIQIKIVPKVKKALINLDTAYDNSVFYSPSTIKVSGWKMANVSNTKIKAYIDNSTTPLADNQITYKKRDDVIAAIKGYGTSLENEKPGFEFNISATNLKSGTHTIKIVVYTKNNEKIKEITSKIKIDRDLHVQYKTHVQNIGWQGNTLDGKTAGTEGRALRIEAINMNLINAPKNAGIIYRTHVQNIGWQSWKSNGQMAGTSGQSLRVEAIEIKLQNMDKYTIEYQVHIQNYGWSGWYIDGETAGTVGQGRRIEAIRIRIVPKYKRSYKGIDVSEFNHSINWALVKRSGVEFAMIRVGYRGYGTEGNFKEDANFRINIESAKKAGVPVGIYFVTQATNKNEAIEEANWVINKIKGYNINYPVAIDIERSTKPNGSGRADDLDKNTRTYLAKTFCQTIQSSGYTPIIYTNVEWATNKLDMSQLSAYDTWIASYKESIQSGPGYNGKYSMWQYTSSGKVDGILGNVDLNICYKKY